MINPSVITIQGHIGQCGYSPTLACRYTDAPMCPTNCPYYWYSQNTKLYRGDRVAQATLEDYA